MRISDENRIKIAQIAYDLSVSFEWDSTKEGGEYWTEVYSKLAELAKKGYSLPDKTEEKSETEIISEKCERENKAMLEQIEKINEIRNNLIQKIKIQAPLIIISDLGAILREERRTLAESYFDVYDYIDEKTKNKVMEAMKTC